MIQQFLYLISMLFSFMFLQVKHPLSLGLILLIQTFLISMLLGLMSQSFWFSYILFLVFVGGLLILFLYTVSMIFNNKFFFSKKNLFIMIFYFIIIMINLYFFLKNTNFFNNNDIMLINLTKSLNSENSLNLNKLFNYPNYMINLLMVSYLFFMLIVVVKITNFYQGPIRTKN